MKALMIVDMQDGQLRENNRHLVKKINNYLKKEKVDKVIYTRFYNHEESPFVQFLGYRDMIDEKDINIAVDLVDDGWIFPKISYGLAPQQLNYLKEKDVDEVILCGTDIDSSVLTIAYNLFDYGIRPYFKWSCCGSKAKNKNVKSNIKYIIKRNFGEESLI